MGIHSAADTEYDWPFYGNLVGAYFKSHPAQQDATIKVADKNHPATKHLPDRWNRFDEWYDYRANPRGDVHVLATLDETSYQNGTMGSDHPITWCQDFGGGRSFYTGLGHTKESYGEPAFQKLLVGAIRWSAGDVAGDCGATVEGRYQKVTLNDFPIEGMGIAPLPGGRVLMTERKGRVMLHDPATGLNTVAAKLDVYQHDEEGVQSIAIDRNFKSNNWVYIYHSLPTGNTPVDDPATPTVNEGDAPFNGTPADFAKFKGVVRLSRYKMQGDEINLDTEQQIIDVPVDRGLCCHVGGHIDFDSQGNLYLSTGDDTNPFESDGYAPIDDRPGRNPGVRRAALGRQHERPARQGPEDHAEGRRRLLDPARGTCSRQGAPQTRPEIYLMGLRNAFRIAINKDNDDLYVGDYSPDANAPDAGSRAGRQGQVVRRPRAGQLWLALLRDRSAPVPGLRLRDPDVERPVRLREADQRLAVQHRPVAAAADQAPGRLVRVRRVGGVPGARHGRHRADGRPGVRLQAELQLADQVAAVLRQRAAVLRVDPRLGQGDAPGRLRQAAEDQPGAAVVHVRQPDGHRVRRGRRAVHARVRHRLLRDAAGGAARTYRLRAREPDADREGVGRSDRQPDGAAGRCSSPATARTIRTATVSRSSGTSTPTARSTRTERNPTHTFEEEGVYNATLKVTDRTGRSASAEVQIIVGNERPTIEFVKPVAGQPFHFGDTVQVEVTVTDDQEVDCTKVQLSYILGHDTHGHPISSTTGCTGQFVTSAGGHDPATQNLRAVFAASYTDPGTGADGEGALTGNAEIALTPTP